MPADDHLRLVRDYPFKQLKSGIDRFHALRASGRLIGLDRKLSAGERDYLDALVVLIRQYEQTHHESALPAVDGIDVLRHLMAEHGMTQRQLAALLKVGELAASMILSGDRELTKQHIAALASNFGVGVAAFFG
jgi:antitoxin component HigA of HigAB toxin-antitoxin module